MEPVGEAPVGTADDDARVSFRGGETVDFHLQTAGRRAGTAGAGPADARGDGFQGGEALSGASETTSLRARYVSFAATLCAGMLILFAGAQLVSVPVPVAVALASFTVAPYMISLYALTERLAPVPHSSSQPRSSERLYPRPGQHDYELLA
ncbi:hypothetical protein [Streptomyces canus]|uniref:hypothetical protein n=1 Tax=Streptomyces canus TaxID=58343 RepID=UPI002E2B8792|nr:hypothetical protein [Streptomyces canus]